MIFCKEPDQFSDCCQPVVDALKQFVPDVKSMKDGFHADGDEGSDANRQSLPERELDAHFRGFRHLPNGKNIYEYDRETNCDAVVAKNLETKKNRKHATREPEEPRERIIGKEMGSAQHEANPD